MVNMSSTTRAMIRNVGDFYVTAEGARFPGKQTDSGLMVAINTAVSPGSVLTRCCDNSAWLVVDRIANCSHYLSVPVQRINGTASVSRLGSGEKDTFGRSAAGPEVIYSDVPFVVESLVSSVSGTDPDRPSNFFKGTLLLPSSYLLNQSDLITMESGSFKITHNPLKHQEGLQQISIMQTR